MVEKELLSKITDRVAELCSQFGVTGCSLKCEQVYDNECIVKIPEDIAREFDEQLAQVADALKDFPGVASVYDAGKGMYRSDGYRAFEMQVKDGHWTHTKADDDAIEEDMREYFDEDYAKEQEEKRRQDRIKNWKKHLLDLPDEKKCASAHEEVYLTLAYEPYDLIKSGEKDYEFRGYTQRYVDRLLTGRVKRVKFQRGYGGPGRPKPEQMVWTVKTISLYDITTRKLTDPWNPEQIVPTHIAIELGKRIK